MNGNTLGIIGKGGLVKQLLYKISSESNANADELDPYDLREMKKLFFENYDKIIFYNYGYNELLTPEENPQGKSFQEACEREFREFGLDINKLGIEIEYCDNDKNKRHRKDGYNNFNDFFQACDVIFDATGPPTPFGKIDPNSDGKKRRYDMFEDNREFIKGGDYLESLVHRLHENLIEEDNENNFTNQVINEFYESLCEDYTEKGKIIPEKEDYVRGVKFAIETIETFAKTFNTGSLSNPIGHRIYELVPFNVPLFLERAEQIKKSSEKLTKVGKSLPVYIMAANEPSIMANIVSSICPEMTNMVVGLTSYDSDRSNESLNEEYNGILREQGLQGKLKLKGVTGIHEKGFMMPLITPCDGYENSFNSVFEKFEMREMVNSSRKLLESYYFRNISKGRKLVNAAINKSAVELLVYSSLSINNPLELHPQMSEKNNFLNNCFFDKDYGLFLNGIHQMRNGYVVSNNTLVQNNGSHDIGYECLLQDVRKLNDLLCFDEDSLIKKYFGISLSPPGIKETRNHDERITVQSVYVSKQKSIQEIISR